MAPHQKKARRLKASLVFIDESGLLLAPVVRRTWAPCGQTPILYQRGRARDKVSIIAALTLSPRQRRPGLYFSLRANENVTTAWLVPFLRALTRHLRGAFVLVWDRLPGHRAQVVTEYLQRRRRDVALLPPYAPELNPVEMLWGYLKTNPLANHPATDAYRLADRARHHFQDIRRRHSLLRSFLRATPLFLRL